MKYIIVLGDGMADEPVGGLGGRTPLEYGKTQRWTGWRKCRRLAWCIRF